MLLVQRASGDEIHGVVSQTMHRCVGPVLRWQPGFQIYEADRWEFESVRWLGLRREWIVCLWIHAWTMAEEGAVEKTESTGIYDQRAVLKTRALQTPRDSLASPNRAMRLECGAFTAAWLRAAANSTSKARPGEL